MANLPRVTAKIFASNAAESDIGQYGSAKTGNKVLTSDIAQIQALDAFLTGWRAAVLSTRNYPTLQEMNGLQKVFSQQIAYLLQKGIAEYDSATIYYANDFCKVGNELYYSLVNNNFGNNPASDGGIHWALYADLTAITTQLNNKANLDLLNITNTGKTVMSNMAMPSSRYIDLAIGTDGSTYTAPADGYFTLHRAPAADTMGTITLTNTSGNLRSTCETSIGWGIRVFMPAAKGQIVRINMQAPSGWNTSVDVFRFVYAKSEES